MVSFRKYKSDTAVEEKAAEPAPQVEAPEETTKAAEAQAAASVEAPPQAEEAAPAEKTTEPSDEPSATPVEDAARHALKQRLKEMETADSLRQEHHQRMRAAYEAREELKKNPPSVEDIIANYPVPDLAKDWLRQHPEFVSNPRANHALQRAHEIAAYAAGEEFTPGYFSHVEKILGLRPKMNGHAVPASVSPAAAPPRPQVQHSAPPVSAPISREAPSMSTGTRVPTQITLSPAEKDLARQLGLTLEQYAESKRRMLREKAAGLHND
jgi:hypothetical protein